MKGILDRFFNKKGEKTITSMDVLDAGIEQMQIINILGVNTDSTLRDLPKETCFIKVENNIIGRV